MKKIEIDLNVCKELGANASVCLAVVNNNKGPLSNTDVAKVVGISFPTAQKILQTLTEKGLIQFNGKRYYKL